MIEPHPELTARQSAILLAVVAHYVRTGEPVGSKTLVERTKLGVSPATVRNEMAALEEAGYVYHPHTSAGRIPTDAGYRHYVDSVPQASRLAPSDVQKIQDFYIEPKWAIEDALRQTAHLLAGLTRHAAIVFAPALGRSHVRHIEAVRLAPGRVMVLVVTDTGRVENRIVSAPDSVTEEDLVRLTESLNRALSGAALDELLPKFTSVASTLAPELRSAAHMIEKALSEGLSEVAAERVYLEGTAHIIDEEKFSDIETVRQVIDVLEHRRLLLEVLADALASHQVSVRIGSENQAAEMQACAVVTAPYIAGDSVLGSLGIVGPTRMDYRRTIAAVYEVSSRLGEMLSNLGA